MPRKIRPRPKTEAGGYIATFAFTRAFRADARAALGTTPRDRGETFLNAAAIEVARYRRRKDQEGAKATVAEQISALEELAEHLGIALRRLIDLDDESEFTLLLQLQSIDGPLTDDDNQRLPQIADDVHVLDRIHKAARAAVQFTKKVSRDRRADLARERRQTGQYLPRDAELACLIDILCDLFERTTGKLITHNPRNRAQYTGEPHSATGKLILDIVKLIDPDVPFTSVSSHLAAWVKRRKNRDSAKS